MALSDRALAQTPAQRIAPLKVINDEDKASHLLVHEIYTSIQGEGTRAGLRCTFVRLTGCHLRCGYCDTEHAFEGGDVRSVDDVVHRVREAGAPLVQLTGGEPLLQPPALTLMRDLSEGGFRVLLETSGAVTTEKVDERVITILDVKTPGSGERSRHLPANLARLRPHDEVKFVLCDEDDYLFARDLIDKENLVERCAAVLLSPVEEPGEGGMDKARLAEWILRDALDARLQLQLHKVIWGDRRGV